MGYTAVGGGVLYSMDGQGARTVSQGVDRWALCCPPAQSLLLCHPQSTTCPRFVLFHMLKARPSPEFRSLGNHNVLLLSMVTAGLGKVVLTAFPNGQLTSCVLSVLRVGWVGKKVEADLRPVEGCPLRRAHWALAGLQHRWAWLWTGTVV